MTLDADTIHTARDEQFAELQENGTMKGDADGLLSLHGERFNIMGADYFMAGILTTLQETYGEGSGGILQQAGETYGEDLTEMMDASGQDGIGAVLGMLAFIGYSMPRVEADQIVVPSSPTAEEYRKLDAEPQRTCYFLAGILSGAVNACTDAEIGVAEEECRADGADRCVFRLREE